MIWSYWGKKKDCKANQKEIEDGAEDGGEDGGEDGDGAGEVEQGQCKSRECIGEGGEPRAGYSGQEGALSIWQWNVVLAPTVWQWNEVLAFSAGNEMYEMQYIQKM